MRTGNTDLRRRRGATGSSGPGIAVRSLVLLISILTALVARVFLVSSHGENANSELKTLEALRLIPSPEEEIQSKDGQARALDHVSKVGSASLRTGDNEFTDASSVTRLQSQPLGPRRTKAHICYSRVHSEIMAKVLRSEMGFIDVDASNSTNDWDLIVGGYPHCGKGPRYLGNFHGWDWDMKYGLNRLLNERGWDSLKPRQVYHPCMGCSATYCNKRELCRILRDHVDPSYCFVLPEDLNRLKGAMAEGGPKVWVAKEDAANVHIHTGKGVSFFSSPNELPSRKKMGSGAFLVQRFNEPFLGKGIWRRKSEMRMYVAITSVYPLRAYAHDKISVVVAAKEYINSTGAMGDKCMVDTHSHTANCDKLKTQDFAKKLKEMGELSSRTVRFEDYADAVGWTDDQRSGLVREAREIISTVVRAGHPALEGHLINRGIQSSGASCFSWMRVDIGISQDLKPFLFEFPEFFGNFGSTNEVIFSSIRDLYRMIGLDQIPIPPDARADFESQHLGGWDLLPNLDQPLLSAPPAATMLQHSGKPAATTRLYTPPPNSSYPLRKLFVATEREPVVWSFRQRNWERVNEMREVSLAVFIYFMKEASRGYDDKKLLPWQRPNWFPGMERIDNKDWFVREMKRYESTPNGRSFPFFPETYCLGDVNDRVAFLRGIQKGGDLSDSAWVLKPPDGARARGIRFLPPRSKELESLRDKLLANIKKGGQQDNDIRTNPKVRRGGSRFVVQKYMENLLTYDGRKFNIRCFFLVASVDPLIVYDCHHGYVHVSNIKLDESDLGSVPKKALLSNAPLFYSDVTFADFDQYLRTYAASDEASPYLPSKSDPFSHVRAQMNAAMTEVTTAFRNVFAVDEFPPENAFLQIGADFFVDRDLKVWMIELNTYPGVSGRNNDLQMREQHEKLPIMVDIITEVLEKQLAGVDVSPETLKSASTCELVYSDGMHA